MAYRQPCYLTDRGCDLLLSGSYDGYEFWILDLHSHPTAYVRVPKGHPCYRKRFMKDDEIDCIGCHGGITYSEDRLHVVDRELKGWFIGWDYAHWGDHLGWETFDEFGKRWTTEEIFDDVKDVIRQLKKAVEGKKGEKDGSTDNS